MRPATRGYLVMVFAQEIFFVLCDGLADLPELTNIQYMDVAGVLDKNF